ncbi:MAG: DUF177 domain-containing protein [Ruminococcus sp.]|nr:DUF177 domain-containing protein [Ruminococcus sp.]
MKIQLRQLFDIVGESVDIDYSIGLDELDGVSDRNFASPVVIKGKIVNRAGVVKLTYDAVASLDLVCDRCLEEFVREYRYSFEHILVASANSDDDMYVVCENDTLDMNGLAVSDILLQLPTKILCKQDCKGLCFSCGKNLNEGDCECGKE